MNLFKIKIAWLFPLLFTSCSFGPRTIDSSDPSAIINLYEKVQNESVEIKMRDDTNLKGKVLIITADSLSIESSGKNNIEIEIEKSAIEELSFPQSLHLPDMIEIKTTAGEFLTGKILEDKGSFFKFEKMEYEKNKIGIKDIETISRQNLWRGASRGILLGLAATPFTQLLFNFTEGSHIKTRSAVANYLSGAITGVIVGGILGVVFDPDEVIIIR